MAFDLMDYKNKLGNARNLKEAFRVIQQLFKEDVEQEQKVNNLLSELSKVRLNITESAGVRVIKIDRDTEDTDNIPSKSRPSEVAPIVRVEVKIPNLKTLQENWEFIADKSSRIEALEFTISDLAHKWRSDPDLPRMLNGLKTKMKTMNSEKQKALKVLERIGTKHLPKSLKQVVDSVRPTIVRGLKGQYDELAEIVYVTPSSKDDKYKDFTFQYYLRFINLSEEDGATYADYCIVFTGIVNANSDMSIFVTTLPKYKLPKTFPAGVAVSNKNKDAVLTVIENLMARHSIQSVINPQAIPLSKKDVKESPLMSLQFVENADVKDDRIIVKLRTDAKAPDINKIYQILYPVIKGMLGIKSSSKSAVTHKLITKGGKRYLEFQLTAGGRSLNLSLLGELKEMLDLTGDEVDALHKIIRERTENIKFTQPAVEDYRAELKKAEEEPDADSERVIAQIQGYMKMLELPSFSKYKPSIETTSTQDAVLTQVKGWGDWRTINAQGYRKIKPESLQQFDVEFDKWIRMQPWNAQVSWAVAPAKQHDTLLISIRLV